MNAKSKEHQTAIVTGASRGIGLGIAQALLERGYRVVANSRTISKSRDLTPSANLVLVDGDIGKKETAIQVVEAAVRHFERIDLLVNNAGIYLPKPFLDYTPEDFATMIGTNRRLLFRDAAGGGAHAQTKGRPYREHWDGVGRSAVGYVLSFL